MALREEFNLPGWNFSILGTDFCTAILERARGGLYRQMEVNRGLPAKLLTRYFLQQGLHWQLQAGDSLDGATAVPESRRALERAPFLRQTLSCCAMC